jgi:hypothetical protein
LKKEERMKIPRFDGQAVWKTLTPEHQQRIGARALELVCAWYLQECAAEQEIDEIYGRMGDAAEQVVANLLLDGIADAVPPKAFLAADGVPLVPSLLGHVCAQCGCSEGDPCRGGCSPLATNDICNVCARKEAA